MPVDYMDNNSEIADALDLSGYKVSIENGYFGFNWYLYRRTPYSDTMPEFTTFTLTNSGTAPTIEECFIEISYDLDYNLDIKWIMNRWK